VDDVGVSPCDLNINKSQLYSDEKIQFIFPVVYSHDN
jgi:hypothetical protein